MFTLALHVDKPSLSSAGHCPLLDPRGGLELRFENTEAIQCLYSSMIYGTFQFIYIDHRRKNVQIFKESNYMDFNKVYNFNTLLYIKYFLEVKKNLTSSWDRTNVSWNSRSSALPFFTSRNTSNIC